MKIRFVLSLLLISTLGGCINLKNEYRETKFLRLQSEPLSIRNIDTIPVSVQIRQFSIADEYNTDRIVAQNFDGRTTIYNFSRWTGNLQDLITDFVTNRLNLTGAFQKGAVKSSTLLIPDLILEGRITNVIAFNAEDDKKSESYVELEMTFNLYKHNQDSAGIEQVFNRTYKQKHNRIDNNVETIAYAMSKATALITDMVFIDIQKAIKK